MTASVISQKEPKAGTFENFVRKKNLEITILLDLNSKKVNNARLPVYSKHKVTTRYP